MAAIILEGLVFARVFERDLRPPCTHLLQLLAPASHILLLFVQMSFIFLNGRVSVLVCHRIALRFDCLRLRRCPRHSGLI